MLQLIDHQTVDKPALKQGHLADPDVLLEIADLLGDRPPVQMGSALPQLFSHVLHEIRMAGVWKRTNAGRLGHTEEMVLRHVDPRHRAAAQILDLGASDGTTTVELLRTVRSAWGDDARAYLTDLNLWLYRYRIADLVEYRAADGEPILVRFGRVGLHLARRHSEAERDMLSRWYLRLAPLRRTMRLDARIPLVNPVVACEPGIAVQELNCLERCDEFVGKFAAVRASNVLNLGYFTSEKLIQAIDHLYSYLREDGCLIVSRNADLAGNEVETGSVWLKRAGKLVRVEDFGGGSEVIPIVACWRRCHL